MQTLPTPFLSISTKDILDQIILATSSTILLELLYDAQQEVTITLCYNNATSIPRKLIISHSNNRQQWYPLNVTYMWNKEEASDSLTHNINLTALVVFKYVAVSLYYHPTTNVQSNNSLGITALKVTGRAK